MNARSAQRFTTVVTVDNRGRAHVPVPFNPDEVWGPKHRIAQRCAAVGA